MVVDGERQRQELAEEDGVGRPRESGKRGLSMMCRVLLLDLGTPRNELSEPLGIEVLASHLEATCPGVSVTLKSLEVDDIGLSGVDTVFAGESYNIIGISTKIRSYALLERVIRSIEEQGSALTVLGDIHATFAYDQILDRYGHVICVRGEGEESIAGIVQCYVKNGESMKSQLIRVPNLAYRSNGSTVLTRRSTIDVREARHPNRALLPDILRQHGIAHLEASRGCIYSSCSFCGISQKYGGTRWRPFQVDYVIDELESLSGAGVKSPYFTDEDFVGDDARRVDAICHKIIEGKNHGRIDPSMNFYFNARVDSILGVGYGGTEASTRMLSLLKRAGLREIFIGIESGSADQIRRYRKATTARKNLAAISLLERMNIEVDLGFILFDPKTTLGDLRANIDFIYRARMNRSYSRIAKKLRLEPLTELAESYVRDHPKAELDLNLVCYEYEFDCEEVADIYHRFYRWEIEDLDVIYNMQSFCRGEVPTEDERRSVKDIIACYRYLDIEYLNSLVAAYEDGLFSSRHLDSITAKFERLRQHLDVVLIDRVKWYDSSYRRYRRSA